MAHASTTKQLRVYYPSSVGILKAPTHQILMIHPELVKPEDFNIAKFEAVHSDNEWIALFRNIFACRPKCYIVIEMHDLFQAHEGNAGCTLGFLRLFQELTLEVTSKGHVLKFLVLCYGGRSDVGDVVGLLKKPVTVPISRKKMVAHKGGLKGWERVQQRL